MTVVTLLLTGRKIKEQTHFPPPPPGAYVLVWEFVIGMWMLSLASWMALDHIDFVIHTAGAIIGLVGCILMLLGAFKMNRPVKIQPKDTTSRHMRISEIKHAKKK